MLFLYLRPIDLPPSYPFITLREENMLVRRRLGNRGEKPVKKFCIRARPELLEFYTLAFSRRSGADAPLKARRRDALCFEFRFPSATKKSYIRYVYTCLHTRYMYVFVCVSACSCIRYVYAFVCVSACSRVRDVHIHSFVCSRALPGRSERSQTHIKRHLQI